VKCQVEACLPAGIIVVLQFTGSVQKTRHYLKCRKALMLQQGFNETKVMGRPAFRFRIEDKTDGQKYSFSAHWEQGAKFHALEKLGHDLEATCWDNDILFWENNSAEARATGIKRAESSAKAKGKEVKETKKPDRPGLPSNSVSIIKAHSVLTDEVSRVAKKTGLDEETRRTVGMESMVLLTHVGYTPEEIKKLCQAYIASLKAYENGASPE